MRPASKRGVGLGLRWEFLDEVLASPWIDVAFFEISPENYMERGGYYPAALERVRERYPIHTHGLSLDLGGTDAPSRDYLRSLRAELHRLGVPFHSDHLAFSRAAGHALHEFFPLKWSRSNAARVADRLRAAEDVLGVPMAIENVTAYVHGGRAEMPEAEFIGTVLELSGAGLVLDVNNAYVNARNFDTDPLDFLRALPLHRVVEIHVAGHERQGELLVDTHGARVCEPVLNLLAWVLERTGPIPVLLERDNNVPALSELLAELHDVRAVYARATGWSAADAIPA